MRRGTFKMTAKITNRQSLTKQYDWDYIKNTSGLWQLFSGPTYEKNSEVYVYSLRPHGQVVINGTIDEVYPPMNDGFDKADTFVRIAGKVLVEFSCAED
jgi:hypothetical protein